MLQLFIVNNKQLNNQDGKLLKKSVDMKCCKAFIIF
jgi:hypothetical protein